MIVVDASVLVVALADDGADGEHCRARVRGEELVAPELIDLEICSALRGLVRAAKLTQRRAQQALGDLKDLPMSRARHAPLLERCWTLRANLTVYDAAYVALAEAIGGALVTADVRLARAAGLRCTVELLRL